ncbi:MAG TPA: glycosyltransferase family 9 protein [Candidatus Acidoferrum sp.]|jgi:ADP-heptose:LPS heptosyltransferase|nr:glycosyltransferase family 9 protein [Candidatus Acidoferrum sp.]
MKILVISLAGIGDTILATPLIRELRANYPEARIDALVLWAGSKDVLEGNPNLNAVYQLNFLKAGKAESLRFLAPLRRAGYDVSINTHPQSRKQYRITARFIGARTRISHEYDCFDVLDRLLVNRTLPQDYAKHTVENNLELLALLGKKPLLASHTLEVLLSAAEREWAESFLSAHQLSQRHRLAVHVGSGGTKNLTLKRWPLDHYMNLLKQVHRTWPELAILLFGGTEEEQDMQKILAALDSPLAIRVPSKNLRQAAALIQRCTAFLSVDTALMHLAAAVQASRQIVIEAPTFNKTNEPYGNPYSLIRNPAIAGRNLEYYRYDGEGIKGTREELIRLMASVSVEAVYEALARALQNAAKTA